MHRSVNGIIRKTFSALTMELTRTRQDIIPA